MYPNLNAERARKNISLETLAQALDKTVATVSLKLSGKAPVTVEEARIIKKTIGTNLPLETLFSKEAIEI